MDGEILNSWKEIATYVGRGVRTVQRWERELRFPVRRPRGKQRSAVIAFKKEIDAWLHSPRVQEAGPTRHITPEVHARLLRNTEELLARTALLLSTSDRINRQVARAMAVAAMRTNAELLRTNTRIALGLAEQIRAGGDDIPVKTGTSNLLTRQN